MNVLKIVNIHSRSSLKYWLVSPKYRVGMAIMLKHKTIRSLTGNLPEIPSLDLERLTRSGSTLNVDGNRQSAADRVIERLNGLDAQKLRQEATEEISGNN